MLLHSIGLKRKPDRRKTKPVTGTLMAVGGVNHKLPRTFKELHQELAEGMVALVKGRLNVEVRKQVDTGLGRGWYERRKKAKGGGQFQCQSCGSRWRGQFSQNGNVSGV